MKQKLANLLFVLLCGIVISILSMFVSKFFISKDVGLAGGAMVLFYGLVAMILGLIAAFFLKNKLNAKQIFYTNILLSILVLSFFVVVYIKFDKSINQTQKLIKTEVPQDLLAH